MKNEEPTMAKVSKKYVLSPLGKSWLLRVLAKITAKKRSYHSNRVPVAEAMMAIRILAELADIQVVDLGKKKGVMGNSGVSLFYTG
jgi:hypothetical protein